jgi:hypothetical protein
MSPGWVTAASGGAGTSSGSTRPAFTSPDISRANSSPSKPMSPRSKSASFNPASSIGNKSQFHSASPPVALSAMR